jgi:hypothetical protein
MVSNIMDKAIQRIIMQRIEKAGSHESGILDMLETPPYFNGKPIKRISIRTNSDALIPLHSTDETGLTGKSGKFDRKVDFVSASSYYATSVSNVDGKPVRKNIRLIDFVNNLNGLQEILTADIWLKQNDILEINGKQYFIIGPGDAMSVRPVYQLNAKDEIKLKAENLKNIKLLKVNQIGEITKTHEFTTHP